MPQMMATAMRGVVSSSHRVRPRGASSLGASGFGMSRNQNKTDPITFNAAVLTASGFEYSADAAFEKAPERALWWLVDGGLIEHTLESPIRFRITDDGRKLRAHVHDEEERTERMSERRKPDPFLRACGELERTLEGLTEEDAAIAIRRALYPLSPGVEKAVAVIRRVMNRHHTDDRTRRRLKSFIESHVDWEVLRTQEEQNSPEGGE